MPWTVAALILSAWPTLPQTPAGWPKLPQATPVAPRAPHGTDAHKTAIKAAAVQPGATATRHTAPLPTQPSAAGSCAAAPAAVPWLGCWTARWCGPCAAQKQILAQLAAEGWDVRVIDFDEHANAGRGWRIASLPTLCVYRGGEELERHVGLADMPAVRRMLQRHCVHRVQPCVAPAVGGG